MSGYCIMPRLRGISRPRPGLVLLVVSLLVAGCGSGPSGPSASPSPTPTATPTPGPVSGRYLLQVVPGPSCSISRAPLTFPMIAAAAGISPHPGIQVVLDGDPAELEWELLSENLTLRGGLGTTGDGVLGPPRGADVVIGDDAEMTRMLEGGVADLATSFDLGSLPWVMVVPAGSPAGSLSALGADRVSVMGGRASRAARESLQTMPAERVRVSRDADELRHARYALVPRSLAGPGEQRPSGVRPLMAVTAMVT